MSEIAAKIDAAAFNRAMKLAPERLYVALRRRIGSFARGWLAAFTRSALRGGGSSAVKVRTGSLVRSFEVVESGTDVRSLTYLVGSTSRYAPIHEYGGTIVPKQSQWLTIPLDAALTAAGVLRASARNWTDTFFRKTADGRLFMFQRQGEEVVPLFRLVKSVTIPARLGFMRRVEEAAPQYVRTINLAVADALAGVR